MGGVTDCLTGLPFPWIVDRHPVIGVLGFVLLGTLVGTIALRNLLFKLTFMTDDLTWHVYTYHINCIILISV